MTTVPTPEQVRLLLSAMSHAQVLALSDKAGVPFTTLWKVRTGETKNPRLETVCAIWPELIGQPSAPTAPTQQEAA